MALVSHGNRLIMCGGHDGRGFNKGVAKYNPDTNEWIDLAPLNYYRYGGFVLAVPNLRFNLLETTCALT